MRRVVVPELLDSDAGGPEEIAASLADLRRVNRWFGGIHTSLWLLTAVANRHRGSRLSLLDVAAGSGDVALALRRHLLARGVQLEITLLDSRLSHLQAAFPGGGNQREKTPLPRRVVGNALALPFRDASFDVVACALFAHHLEPGELIAFANDALRVCRTAVLINDLRRSAASLALVFMGFPLFRGHLSWRDGLTSVRRAYTVAEMRAMLSRTRAARVEIARHYLFRLGAIAWKAKDHPTQLREGEHNGQRTTSTSRILSRPRKNLIEE